MSPNYQAQRRRAGVSARGRASARVRSWLGRPRPSTLCVSPFAAAPSWATVASSRNDLLGNHEKTHEKYGPHHDLEPGRKAQWFLGIVQNLLELQHRARAKNEDDDAQGDQ